MPDVSLDDLLSTLCDGQPAEEVYEQLGRRLSHDPAARQTYLDCLLVHAILQWDHAVPAEERQSLDPVDNGKSPVCEGRLQNKKSPLLGSLGIDSPTGLAGWTQVQFSLGIMLAAVLISSGLTAVAMRWQQIRWQQAPAARGVAVSEPPTRAAEYIATLVNASDVRWDRSEQPMVQGARLPAGEMRLAEGVMEIMFDSGVKVLLQGPAQFVPQSNRSGLLRRGRLVAQCPPGSRPFVVQTPIAVAVGEDAEFAVEATADGTSKVHVYSGSVDVAGRNRSSTGVPRSHLAAGEALLVEAAPDAQLVPLAPQGDAFVRWLPDRRRHFPTGLVSYWNFDEQGGPAFDLQGQNHGLLQGVTRSAGLVGKGAIAFSGQPGQQVSAGAGENSPSFTTGITVESLFISRWNGAEGNYDEIFRKEDGDRRILLSLQNDRQGNQVEPRPVPPRPVLAFGLNVAGVYSELELPLDGQQGRPSVAQLADGRAHHVVAAYDAASGLKAIYLDGKPGCSQQFAAGAEIRSGGSQPISIGNIFGGWEPFAGVIDEVAIYVRALTAAEIAEHWRQVQRGRGYFEVPAEPDDKESI
jgi:hypothetical protein